MSLTNALADWYRERLKRFPLVRVPKEALWYAIWYARWRLIHPVARVLVWVPKEAVSYAGWYMRWRVVHPVVSAVVRVSRFALSYCGWYTRWHVVHPATRALVRVPKEAFSHSVRYARWHVVRPAARALLPQGVLRRYHVVAGMGRRGMLKLWAPPEPPTPMVPYAAAGGEARMIFPAVTVRSGPPAVFPARLAPLVAMLPDGFAFPAVTLRRWSSAEVVARSNMIVEGGRILHHDLYRFTRDYTSEELHGRLRILPLRPGARRLEKLVVDAHFGRAASFTDSCSPNYAHWLTEVLPRLHAYARAGIADDTTLLLDAGLHRNLIASAELVAGGRAHFHMLEPGHAARVDLLDVVSPGGYIPFDRRGRAQPGDSHGIFSAPALASLRQHLADTLGAPAAGTPTKILIRRRSSGRALVNEQALEDRLVALGFVPVYPEHLSFVEQFHLFSNVNTVVGATGAAMANLIFCPVHAHVVICLSAHPQHSFGYWQNMAAAVGNSVTYVLGPVVGARRAGIHADFSIDIEEVLDAIRSRTGKAEAIAPEEPSRALT